MGINQPFNVRALQDPGLGAAANLLGSGIQALNNRLIGQDRNRNNLQNTLLGQAGLGVREVLENSRQNEQGRSALEFAIQSGQVPGLPMGTEVPEDLKINPTSVNSLITQGGYNALINRNNNILRGGKIMAEGGIPGSDQVLGAGGGGLTSLISGGAANPSMPVQPLPNEALPLSTSEPQLQKSSDGVLRGGVTADPPVAGNLYSQKAAMDNEAKKLALRGQRITSQETDPNFIFGEGNTSVADLTAKRKQGVVQPAVDQIGVPLDQEMTPRLAISRNTFASYDDNKKGEIKAKTESSPAVLNQYVSQLKDVIALKTNKTVDRMRLKLLMSGATDQLGELTPAEEAAKSFVDQTAPLVIQAAGADQSANSISNRDVEPFKRAIGDPTSDMGTFVRNTSAFTAKAYLSALKNAANTNAAIYNDLKGQLEDLSGQPFNYEDIDNIPKFQKAIADNIVQTQKSSQLEAAQQGLQRTSQPRPQAAAPVQGGDEIDAILKRYGRL